MVDDLPAPTRKCRCYDGPEGCLLQQGKTCNVAWQSLWESVVSIRDSTLCALSVSAFPALKEIYADIQRRGREDAVDAESLDTNYPRSMGFSSASNSMLTLRDFRETANNPEKSGWD